MNPAIRIVARIFCAGGLWAWSCFPGPILAAEAGGPAFRAGAAVIDITPEHFPVIVNAMFTQRQATNAHDRLHARGLALDDGNVRLVMVVVDSCMLPRDLIDRAKELAAAATGIPTGHMLVSATHTHSAPSSMGCLGSDPDPEYVRFLPSKIAECIEASVRHLGPARIGWASVQDEEHTHCRRWIYRSDRVKSDPFGAATVRANMHPGYENPEVIGPSGPVDAGLSVLSVQSPSGEPIALLANYSMHYYDSPLISADYYGVFAAKITEWMNASVPADRERPFVAIMSQGTSGDQMWMDYSKPRQDPGLERYAGGIATNAYRAYQRIQYRDWVPLGMKETKLTLRFRVPDTDRLAWAEKTAATFQGRLPQSLPEVYAREQLFLHERPEAELKLQAIRIGELGIAAIPNEVYGISGLKIKAQSPFPATFTIELANGSEGYIPPPEQHVLGGYTTWPARTAGLERTAEPKIVNGVLNLLEELAGKRRRDAAQKNGHYPAAVLGLRPMAFWRLNEFNGPNAEDESGHGNQARYEEGVAFYLMGAGPATFSEGAINRAPHFAGGRVRARLSGLGERYSIAFWLWNGFPADAREVTGYLMARQAAGASGGMAECLGITGKRDGTPGRIFFASGTGSEGVVQGRSMVPLKTWAHVVLVRDVKNVAVYLNGNPSPECARQIDTAASGTEAELFIGGREDGTANFEGKLDEVAVFNRALQPQEIADLYRAADF